MGGWVSEWVDRDRWMTYSLVLVEFVKIEDEVTSLWTREPQELGRLEGAVRVTLTGGITKPWSATSESGDTGSLTLVPVIIRCCWKQVGSM